mmetsp:Transcript_35916/g.55149  ORF Transcript_35916/g.55149 Transcript_35916/m.55149 type:complete len:316 (-) Transcript_35916:1188-2135(-)
MDQFTFKHMLPLYLSKITNPDQSILIFDEDSLPKRGIRTFGEIAHYVRCIPYQSRDNFILSENNLWQSPDFAMTIKVGTEEDHALLMASIFRTCKHEDQLEFNRFAKEQRKKTVTRKDKDKELLSVTIAPTPGTEKPAEEEKESPDGETKQEEEKKEEEKPTDDKDGPSVVTDTVDDRVFVCLGKSTDGQEKRQIWVMTINRTFDTITFWEPKTHKHYVLRGRIEGKEAKYLEAYLSPNLTPEEKEEIDKIREMRAKERATLGTIGEDDVGLDFGGKYEDSDDDDEDDEKEEEDDEKQSDSDFMEDIEKVVDMSD